MKSINQIPLVQVEVPTASILTDKEILDKFYARVKEKYNDNKYLKIFKFEDGFVAGSNSFSDSLMNELLNEQGFRITRQSDLERLIKINPNYLNGTYEDTGLALRDEKDPNSYLAQNLIKQLESRMKLKLPVMIPLTELSIENDPNSNYGLSFKLKECADIIYAPILNKQSGKFSSEDVDEKSGLPKKLGNGDRTFYTRESGLSRLFLYRDLDLLSYVASLGGSGSDGRVVIVSGEATPNFDSYIQKLTEEKERQNAEIEAKYQKAVSFLKEGK